MPQNSEICQKQRILRILPFWRFSRIMPLIVPKCAQIRLFGELIDRNIAQTAISAKSPVFAKDGLNSAAVVVVHKQVEGKAQLPALPAKYARKVAKLCENAKNRVFCIFMCTYTCFVKNRRKSLKSLFKKCAKRTFFENFKIFRLFDYFLLKLRNTWLRLIFLLKPR